MSKRRVLVRAVHHATGEPLIDLHVFCARQARSMRLETCRECPHCERVEPGEASEAGEGLGLGYVVCGPDDSAPPSAGDLLDGETLCAGDDVSATNLRAFFVERGVARVLVVTPKGLLVGVVDERDFVAASLGAGRGAVPLLAAGLRGLSAHDLARAEATVQGTASVRDALKLMAERRRRHVVVVDTDGTPLGVLSDVVALRGLTRR